MVFFFSIKICVNYCSIGLSSSKVLVESLHQIILRIISLKIFAKFTGEKFLIAFLGNRYFFPPNME